jgi:hypothetical protein
VAHRGRVRYRSSPSRSPDVRLVGWVPRGRYTFFAALADAGTLNIGVLGIDTVTFGH